MHVDGRYLFTAGESVRAVVDEVVGVGVVVRGCFGEVDLELEAPDLVELSARDVQPDGGVVEGLVQAWVHVGLVERMFKGVGGQVGVGLDAEWIGA